MDKRLIECCYKYHGLWPNITQYGWERHLKLSKLPYFPFSELLRLTPEFEQLLLRRKIRASIDWEFKQIRVHGPSVDKWRVAQAKKDYSPMRKALDRMIESLKKRE